MSRCGFLYALLTCIALSVSVSADTLFDTTGSWNGVSNHDGFGEGSPSFATYGQTFTVPAFDTVLDDITFFLNDDTCCFLPDFVEFRVHVMAWDAASVRATGILLFSTPPLATTGAVGFETFTVNTGGLSLTAGNQFVFFMTQSQDFDGVSGKAPVGYIPGASTLAGGNLVLIDNGTDTSAWTTEAWQEPSAPSVGADLAFVMNFSPVPEPSGAVSLGMGLFLLAGGSWRPRRSSRGRFLSYGTRTGNR